MCRNSLAKYNMLCYNMLCDVTFRPLRRYRYSISRYSSCLYDGFVIVRRPSAALLTTVIRMVRRPPYALLTAVERRQ